MNKVPFVTKEQVEEMARTYPTPFHLYDERGSGKCKSVKRGFFMESGIQRIFCGESDAESVFDADSSGIWMRL